MEHECDLATRVDRAAVIRADQPPGTPEDEDDDDEDGDEDRPPVQGENDRTTSAGRQVHR